MFSHPFSCVVFLKSKEWCWYHSYPENQPSECQLPQVNIYKYLYLTLQSIKRGGCQSQSPGVSDHEEANPWMHWIHNSQGSWAKCEIIYIYICVCVCARVCVCVYVCVFSHIDMCPCIHTHRCKSVLLNVRIDKFTTNRPYSTKGPSHQEF